MREIYSDQEAEEILKIASSKVNRDGLTRQKLIETAAELGITPEQLLEAERELAERQEEETYAREFDKKQRADFAGHLITYVLVSIASVVIFYTKVRVGVFWPMFMIGGWGIGVVGHGYNALNRNSPEYKKGLEQWIEKQKKKQRRKEMSQRLASKAESLISEILTVNPTDRQAAVRNLREQVGLSVDDAKRAVEDYIVKNRLR